MIHIRFLLAALLNLTCCVAYTQASQSPAREHFEKELQKCRDVKWREDLRVFYTYADFQLCWIGNDRLFSPHNRFCLIKSYIQAAEKIFFEFRFLLPTAPGLFY